MEILTEAIEEAGFRANIVSNADDSGIIHKRIIQNLYDNPIVVCDVSGKNPNAMFELGMRLAFDKPTIIVKDDKTNYSFDTSQIEHLPCPRDLRFSKIVEFKQKLTDKIVATFNASCNNDNYTTFLKHFGEFTVAKLDKKEVSGQDFILEEMRNIRQGITQIEIQKQNVRIPSDLNYDGAVIDLCLKDISSERIEYILARAKQTPGLEAAKIRSIGDNHKHIFVRLSSPSQVERSRLRGILKSLRQEALK